MFINLNIKQNFLFQKFNVKCDFIRYMGRILGPDGIWKYILVNPFSDMVNIVPIINRTLEEQPTAAQGLIIFLGMVCATFFARLWVFNKNN